MNIFFSISATCRGLEKLSLGKVEYGLDEEDVDNILKSASTLEVLHIEELKGEISLDQFKKLVTNLTELTELNLTFKSATKDTISFVCNNVSLKLKRVSFGQMDVTDEDIEALVTRCQNLVELDLSGCKSLTNLVIEKIIPSQNLVTLRLPGQIEFSGLHRVRKIS